MSGKDMEQGGASPSARATAVEPVPVSPLRDGIADAVPPVSIDLKWGNLKGWSGFSEGHPATPIARKFLASTGISAMERLTPEQKAMLCDLIDHVDGEIRNDWSGEVMTTDEAKKYVSEYGE